MQGSRVLPKPRCQTHPVHGKDIPNKKCQAALLDNSEEYIVIVYEKSFPVHLRKWGLPKGKFKEGEDEIECSHREVCEEVGIQIDEHPHIYRKTGKDQIIVFLEPRYIIPIIPGPEILRARWVNLNWLKRDMERNPRNYNMHARRLVPKI